MATKSIKIDNLAKQFGLLAAMLACAVGVYFVVKWCAANATASHTIFSDVAGMVEDWAPSDPQTHYTSAVLAERNFAAPDSAKALEEYERATALAPNDYRTWLALGEARERAGIRDGAEAALQRARQLAPNYSQVNWTLGNVLLRAGKQSEAFAEMRRAAEADRNYVNPTVATAWQLFGGDLAQMRQVLGDSPAVSAAFVEFLAREKRFDDAVKIWNSLPVEQRTTTFKDNGAALYEQMIAAGKFRAAVQTMAASGGDAGNFAVGRIANGGFESDIKPLGAAIFDWQIGDGGQPAIGVDDRERHGGERSLTVLFNSSTGKEFRVVSQTVAVEPGAHYEFEVFYKSDLKSSATVYWDIAEFPSGKTLAQTPATAPAAADWTSLKTQFTVPETAEAVVVRFGREPCKSTLCPISGRILFDDLSINRVNN